MLFGLQAVCVFCDHKVDRKDVIKMQLHCGLQAMRKDCRSCRARAMNAPLHRRMLKVVDESRRASEVVENNVLGAWERSGKYDQVIELQASPPRGCAAKKRWGNFKVAQAFLPVLVS